MLYHEWYCRCLRRLPGAGAGNKVISPVFFPTLLTYSFSKPLPLSAHFLAILCLLHFCVFFPALCPTRPRSTELPILHPWRSLTIHKVSGLWLKERGSLGWHTLIFQLVSEGWKLTCFALESNPKPPERAAFADGRLSQLRPHSTPWRSAVWFQGRTTTNIQPSYPERKAR